LIIYVPAIPFLFAFSHYMEESIPHVPGTTVPLIWIGPGEVAVHLAGAAVFVLAGFRKPTLVWTVLLLAAVLQGSAWSRGGMLAFVLPVTFAAILLGTIRELMVVLVIGLLIFAAAYMLEPVFNDYREANSSVERSVSTRQIVDNVASIAGRASEQTEDTKKWRLDWWDVIIKNTIYGPYFWTGRGFGLNLAEADGRTTGRSARPLRSPHNVQMTILARAGVPGLALWAALLAAWLGMLMRAMWTARRRGQADWARLFLFIGCYAVAIVINATFDVALEGPVQGVWFWCLFGFGIGSVMVYRTQPYVPA
jgi:O-antigen ligase